jgi:hypothetical protein
MGGVPFVTDAPVFCSATNNRIRGRVDRAVRGVVVDRGEPVASCLEWHGDGTAGENDCGSGLAATVPARAMVRPAQGDASLVGKSPKARQVSYEEGFGQKNSSWMLSGSRKVIR